MRSVASMIGLFPYLGTGLVLIGCEFECASDSDWMDKLTRIATHPTYKFLFCVLTSGGLNN